MSKALTLATFGAIGFMAGRQAMKIADESVVRFAHYASNVGYVDVFRQSHRSIIVDPILVTGATGPIMSMAYEANAGIVNEDAITFGGELPNVVEELCAVGSKAVFMAAIEGFMVDRLREPNPDRESGKWIVRAFSTEAFPITHTLGMYCDALSHDSKIGSFRDALRDIKNGRLDVIVWLDRPSAFNATTVKVSQTEGIDLVSTGSIHHWLDRDERHVYNREKIPVETYDPTGIGLDLCIGEGRHMFLLTTDIVGIVKRNAPQRLKEKVSAAFYAMSHKDHLLLRRERFINWCQRFLKRLGYENIPYAE